MVEGNGHEEGGCPRCHCLHSSVKETRLVSIHGFQFRVRIRLCRYCKMVYRSREVVDQTIKLPSRKKPELPEVDVTPPETGENPFL